MAVGLELFMRNGFQATTLDMVAASVGIARRAFSTSSRRAMCC
ncbi:TetR family transcriptional regulator [Salinicola peritrichatus]